MLVIAGLCVTVTTAQAGDLQKIEKAGKLSVALSGAFPPFSFVDESNKVVGFDVDIGTEMARRLKVEPNIVTTAWDGIIAGLVTGRYDIRHHKLSTTSLWLKPNGDRQEYQAFSANLAISRSIRYVAFGPSPINSIFPSSARHKLSSSCCSFTNHCRNEVVA
ncbi:transporter substrate-binding domain-containing protein [Agrobacterium fabrum]|uniref:transporter substrate-binding domain-containing protein n=1 Tax=Agrobacterium fabrum TaxID=1176649 RepID=UPI003BA17450